jgi:hypothetical protein
MSHRVIIACDNQSAREFSPVGQSMAEFMHQNDVHHLSSFSHDCFLTRALCVDPSNIEVNFTEF